MGGGDDLEPAGLGDGRPRRGAGDPAHAGLADGIADAEEIAERCVTGTALVRAMVVSLPRYRAGRAPAPPVDRHRRCPSRDIRSHTLSLTVPREDLGARTVAAREAWNSPSSEGRKRM